MWCVCAFHFLELTILDQVTDGIRMWTGVSGSADRPKSLQIESAEYLSTLKNVLTQSVKSDEYQVMIAPRNKAVVLTIKLQQLRFFQKSLTTAASHDIQRQFFQRIASRSRDTAHDNQQLKQDNDVLRFLRLMSKHTHFAYVHVFLWPMFENPTWIEHS